jgi:hypothetical protein
MPRARLSGGGRGAVGRVGRHTIEIPEREPEFRQARQGSRIVRMIGHCLQHLIARRFELQVRLQRVRQRQPRGRGLRTAPDRLATAGERRCPIVLRHRDGGTQGIDVAFIRVERCGPIEIGARLVQASRTEEDRSPPDVEAGVALITCNLVELLQRISWQNRLVVQRPLDGVSRTNNYLLLRGLALHRDCRFVARERQAPLRVGRRHVAFEHGDERAVRLHAHEELRALDGGVDERRLHLQRSRLAREEEDGAPDQLDQCPGRSRRLMHDPLGVLIDDQPRVVLENHGDPASLAGSDRVAEADVQVHCSRRESGSRRRFVLDDAIEPENARAGRGALRVRCRC